ncbi:hypothetical protein KAI87_01590 [Myxococcota bacterium]|nr:hypothetical protein [Myxococcota bacterium]
MAFFWPQGMVPVAAGGALMGGNFWLSRYLALKIIESDTPKMGYVLALGMKLMLVVVLMGLLVAFWEMDPVFFVIGMTTLFSGVAFAMVHLTVRPVKDETKDETKSRGAE